MRRAVLAPWKLSTLLLLFAAPGRSDACCNVIPGPLDQLAAGPNPTPAATALLKAVQADAARFGPELSYKGALGRMDHPSVPPTSSATLRVAADGVCVSVRPDSERKIFSTADTANLVAAAITTGAGPTTRRLSGPPELCDAIGHTSDPQSITKCNKGGIKTAGVQGLDITFPQAPVETFQPVRIAVFHAATVADAERLLGRIAAADCATLCADEALNNDLGVCIDRFYAPVELTATGQIVYAADMVRCSAQNTPSTIPWNDFGSLCEPTTDGTGLPGCAVTPAQNALSMWEDECHGVYIPIDWTSVRHEATTTTLSSSPSTTTGAAVTTTTVNRYVRGSSGISRHKEFEGGRIFIPGREYVGTLLEQDVIVTPGSVGTPDNGGFISDPRSAALDMWYPTPQEVGLQGVADKDQTIVYMVPRLAASYLCDQTTASGASDEACMRVATQPALPVTRCACTDRYGPDCTCSTITKARYFQCAISNMPCTRHAHCNLTPNDTCSARPRCQPKDTVWDPTQPTTTTLPTGTAPPTTLPRYCWYDDDCQQPNEQCGFLLFDVKNKRTRPTGPPPTLPPTSVVTLDRIISSTGSKKQRGVCKGTTGNSRAACSNGNGANAPAACAANQGDCIGFTLEALGKR